MGFPAARLTAPTVHGGNHRRTFLPYRFDRGLLAARITDMHTCPMGAGFASMGAGINAG